MNRGSDPLFHEEQRFEMWLWLLLVGIGLTVALPVGLMFTWANLPPWSLAMGLALPFAVAAFVWLLFWSLTMVTEVRDRAVTVRFRPVPFWSWTLPLDGLTSHQAETYHPVREFGGWGIQCARGRKRAFNVSGNRGVRLIWADGRQVVIGSQRAEELDRAITALLARRHR